MLIIDDLLFWLPAKGFMGIAKRIEEEAKKETDEESEIATLLAKNQLYFEMGRLKKDEFLLVEEKLFERLKKLKSQEKI